MVKDEFGELIELMFLGVETVEDGELAEGAIGGLCVGGESMRDASP